MPWPMRSGKRESNKSLAPINRSLISQAGVGGKNREITWWKEGHWGGHQHSRYNAVGLSSVLVSPGSGGDSGQESGSAWQSPWTGNGAVQGSRNGTVSYTHLTLP